ncbi:MAG TPA: hypothetical protein VHQ23_16190 [Ilumatobacteraceae bacterium]|nr:hypothetical protein [Ilumatobacteraceae bacterium]
MDTLTWREVDFAGVVLAGVAAGYLMALVGLWAGRVPGLVAIDIADHGRKYMVSDRSSAWLIGLLSHLLNSVLLVLVWAMVVLPNLDINRVLAGLVWGEALAIVLAGGLVGPLSGIGFMGLKTANTRFALTNLLIHAVWGVVIGLLYVPR